MREIHTECSRVIDAPASLLYEILADYRVGHVVILPKPYFVGIHVLEGGTGAGTVVDVEMCVWGVTAKYHMVVTEPEPGRTLVETDEEAGVVTTFTVEPMEDTEQARVTIAIRSRSRGGLRGLLERWFTPMVTRKILRQELQNLENHAKNRLDELSS